MSRFCPLASITKEQEVVMFNWKFSPRNLKEYIITAKVKIGLPLKFQLLTTIAQSVDAFVVVLIRCGLVAPQKVSLKVSLKTLRKNV